MKRDILLTLFAGLILTISSYFIYPVWSIMVSLWFLAVISIKLKRLDKSLSLKEKNLFNIYIFFYPISETIIRLIMINIESPPFLNRIEHLYWTFSLVILFLPIIKKFTIKFSKIQKLLFIICFVSFIGNLNEFFEYLLRYYNQVQNLGLFYSDTIFDMVINIIGSMLGFFTLEVIDKSQ